MLSFSESENISCYKCTAGVLWLVYLIIGAIYLAKYSVYTGPMSSTCMDQAWGNVLISVLFAAVSIILLLAVNVKKIINSKFLQVLMGIINLGVALWGLIIFIDPCEKNLANELIEFALGSFIIRF